MTFRAKPPSRRTRPSARFMQILTWLGVAERAATSSPPEPKPPLPDLLTPAQQAALIAEVLWARTQERTPTLETLRDVLRGMVEDGLIRWTAYRMDEAEVLARRWQRATQGWQGVRCEDEIKR